MRGHGMGGGTFNPFAGMPGGENLMGDPNAVSRVGGVEGLLVLGGKMSNGGNEGENIELVVEYLHQACGKHRRRFRHFWPK